MNAHNESLKKTPFKQKYEIYCSSTVILNLNKNIFGNRALVTLIF